MSLSHPSEADIIAMHAAYVRGSGLAIELTMQRRFAWEPLWAKGVRAADVALVIAHLKAKRRRGEPVRQLTFRTFVGFTEAFEEDLAEARAANRVQRRDPARTAALAATGRPAASTPQPGGRLDAAPLPPSETAAAVLNRIVSREEFAAELAKVKEELG